MNDFSLRTFLPLCDCAEIGVAYEIRWPRNVTSFTLDCGRARQLVYQWKAGDILCLYWPKIFPGWCLLFSPSVGGSDYWVTSDSPRRGPARTQEAGNPLDYVATDFWLRFLGLFSSWVGEHCVVGSSLSCLGFLWPRCRCPGSPVKMHTIPSPGICPRLNCSFSHSHIIVCSSVIMDNFCIFSQCFLSNL